MTESDRPPSQVLDLFWRLVEPQQEKRVLAVHKLRTFAPSHRLYVFERLVRGLLSSRCAARVGYATALSTVVETGDHVRTVIDKAEQLYADQEPDVAALATVFLCAALLRCSIVLSDHDLASDVVKRLWSVQKRAPKLRQAVVMVIAELCKKVDDHKTFKSLAWETIEKKLVNLPNSFDRDFLWLALSLDLLFEKLTKNLPLIELFKNEQKLLDYLNENASAILQATDQTVHPLCCTLLDWCALRQQKLLSTLWNRIFESRTFGSDSPKWIAYGCAILTPFIRLHKGNDDSTPENLVPFFSPTLLQCCQRSLLPRSMTAPFLADSIDRMLNDALDVLTGSSESLWNVLRAAMHSVPTFDRVVHRSWVVNCVRALDEHHALKHAKSAIKKLSTTVEGDTTTDLGDFHQLTLLDHLRALCTGRNRSKKIRVLVLTQMLEWATNGGSFSTRARHTLYTVLRGMLSVHMVRGKVVAAIADEDIRLFARLMLNLVKDENDVKNDDEQSAENIKLLTAAARLVQEAADAVDDNVHDESSRAIVVLLLASAVAAVTTNQMEHYELLEELLSYHEQLKKMKENQNPASPSHKSKKNKLNDSNGADCVEEMMDLLMSLMSRDDQILRAAAPTALFYLRQHILPSHLEPLCKAVDVSNIDDPLIQDETEDETGKEELAEDSGLEDAVEDVNPKLIDAVKEALGEAIDEQDDDDDKSSVVSDLSDRTMLRLDDSLAAAFRAHISARKEESKNEVSGSNEKNEALRIFRSRVCELLAVIVHAPDTVPFRTLLSLLCPLLRGANEAIRLKSEHAIYSKLSLLLRHLCDFSPKDGVSVDSSPSDFCDAFDAILETAKQIWNPAVQTIAGSSVSTLIRWSLRTKQQKDDSSAALLGRFTDALREYFTNPQSNIPASLLENTLNSHSDSLIDICLPVLCEFANNDEIRPFHKVQATSWIVIFVNKPHLIDFERKPRKRTWKTFAKMFDAQLDSLLRAVLQTSDKDTLNSEETEANAPVRPQFVRAVLQLAYAVVKHLPLRHFKHLSDAEWLSSVVQPLTTQERWRSLRNHRELLTTVTSGGSGRHPHYVCSAILRAAQQIDNPDDKEKDADEPESKRSKTK